MGRKAILSAVRAKGRDRIQFDFELDGKRYRPTVDRIPSEANLRRAHKQLQDIRDRIKNGTFAFDEEFPDYRYKDALQIPLSESAKTCSQVFDDFLAHCDARVAINDMAFSTADGYRHILESVWRPAIGKDLFKSIIYSRLQKIASGHTTSKKTYNNVVSALRCAFEFGYKDHPQLFNPASGLKTLRISKKDRPAIDPFTIQEAEAIIARSHLEFGEAHGNYEEFRFFTGLRQSEQFALLITGCDLSKGTIKITKARVRARNKSQTKTGIDREITLCPRALAVLARQLALRESLVAARKVSHDHVFFQDDGAPLFHLSYPYKRWRYVLRVLGTRYRDAYNARHSFISWSLMIGKNILKVAEEDGHSVQTMLSTYAAWTKGATEGDIETIRAAMERSLHDLRVGVHATTGSRSEIRVPLQSPEAGTKLAPERGWGRLSWRQYSQRNGGADGTRIPPAAPEERNFELFRCRPPS
jgi:integrase